MQDSSVGKWHWEGLPYSASNGDQDLGGRSHGNPPEPLTQGLALLILAVEPGPLPIEGHLMHHPARQKMSSVTGHLLRSGIQDPGRGERDISPHVVTGQMSGSPSIFALDLIRGRTRWARCLSRAEHSQIPGAHEFEA